MRKILLYTILACTLALGSCNDWLDVKPRQQNEEEEQFGKTKGFQDALIACYIKMNSRTLYGEQLTMRAIEWMAQHWSYGINNTADQRTLKGYDYDAAYCVSLFKSIYAEFYNVISQANTVLVNLKENGHVVDDPAKKAILEAEALGIRAFVHMDVLRLFGQLPQNATVKVSLPYAETVSYKAPIPYYDYNAFAVKILDDLNRAETLLLEHDPIMVMNEDGSYAGFVDVASDDFYSYRRFRVNYYSILAMKARLYMYMGKPGDAKKYANDVIEAFERTGQMQLAGDADFLAGDFALPSECIFALSNSELAEYAVEVMAVDDWALWQEEDAINKVIYGTTDMAVNNRAMSLWNMNALHSGGATRPLIKKYLQPTGTDRPGMMVLATRKEVIPLIRLSEMYLIAIETTPYAAANDMYKTYMKARNVTNPKLFESDEAKMDEIVNEYRREFFAEGQMFYTYKRLGASEMAWTDEKIVEKNYVVPLPDTEIKGN